MNKVIKKYNLLSLFSWKVFYVLLAWNYFAFRTELFSEEFEQNNPVRDPFANEIVLSSIAPDWETFDKDNAPKAFVIKPQIHIQVIGYVHVIIVDVYFYIESSEPVRDKSPPTNLIHI